MRPVSASSETNPLTDYSACQENSLIIASCLMTPGSGNKVNTSGVTIRVFLLWHKDPAVQYQSLLIVCSSHNMGPWSQGSENSPPESCIVILKCAEFQRSSNVYKSPSWPRQLGRESQYQQFKVRIPWHLCFATRFVIYSLPVMSQLRKIAVIGVSTAIIAAPSSALCVSRRRLNSCSAGHRHHR